MNNEFGMRRWAIVALAIVAAVAIGGTAYQAGVSHGLALNPPAAAAPPAANGAPSAQPPYPYYPYPYRYGPWRGGSFLGPVLFVFFWIFLFRLVFWGAFGRRRWRRDPDYWLDRFDDWHRRAHERMRGEAPVPPAAS